MKLKIKCLNLLTLISLIGMMISLSACWDANKLVKEEVKEVLVMGAVLCTSDLLEFVTPVVTIQGVNGEKETFRLTKENFKNILNHDFPVNIDFLLVRIILLAPQL